MIKGMATAGIYSSFSDLEDAKEKADRLATKENQYCVLLKDGFYIVLSIRQAARKYPSLLNNERTCVYITTFITDIVESAET